MLVCLMIVNMLSRYRSCSNAFRSRSLKGIDRLKEELVLDKELARNQKGERQKAIFLFANKRTRFSSSR